MQAHKFDSPLGGYVAHKLRCGPTKCSAWYDADGALIDAERFDSRNRSYPIKRSGPMWRYLARQGATVKAIADAAECRTVDAAHYKIG